VRYMLMICDDESDGRSPLELVRDPEHVAWIDYLDRRGVPLLDGVRLRPSTDATNVKSRNGETLVSDGPFMRARSRSAATRSSSVSTSTTRSTSPRGIRSLFTG